MMGCMMAKAYMAFLFGILIACLACCAQETAPRNGDFEKGEAGKRPGGWFFSAPQGTVWRLDDKAGFRNGKLSLRADSDGKRTYCMSPRFPISAGRRYTAYAYMKTDPPGLLVRIYFDAGRIRGRHTYWSGDYVPGAEWREFEFSVSVPHDDAFDSAQMAVRFDLMEKGTLWVDDVRVEDTTLKLTHAERRDLERASRPRREPKLLFHASFDGTLDAEAAGEEKPLRAENVRFEPGLSGEGVFLDENALLEYAAAGHLDKRQGTISVWISTRWQGDPPRDCCFFMESPPGGRGSNQVRIWKWGNILRLDIRDPNDKFLRVPVPAWRDGEWHNLTAVWDNERGARLYVDGMAFVRFHYAGEERFRWEPIEHASFFVGTSANRRNQAPRVVFDELKIYSGCLSPAEIKRQYFRRVPVEAHLKETIFKSGTASRTELLLRNRSNETFDDVLRYQLKDGLGRVIKEGKDIKVTIPPGGKFAVEVSFSAAGSGDYSFSLAWRKSPHLGRILSMYVYGTRGPGRVVAKPGIPADLLKPVDEIDCVTETSPERFCEMGKSVVRSSPLGKYRESAPEKFSRLAYRFKVKTPRAPHQIVIEYPDDKERIFDIMLSSPEYPYMMDVQSGIYMGGELRNFNRMRKFKIFVWPREEQFALIFLTWEKDKPAAVKKITVYEIEGGLPELAVGSDAGRMIGLYWEDPTINSCFGNLCDLRRTQLYSEFERTLDNCTDYMKYTGQNVLTYPLCWYSGPIYPSRVEGAGRGAGSNRHPGDFVEFLLKKFADARLNFIGEFRTFGTYSLMENAVTDRADIWLGKDTYNMIRRDGGIAASTRHGMEAMFNPIHPKVQAAILALVDEVLERYGDYPSFKGINFIFHPSEFFWFHSLESGYGDYNANLFARERGIEIPFDVKDPFRFAKRAEWILKNHRREWIDWRCEKIGKFLLDVAERVRAKRSDLLFVLTFREPCGEEAFERIHNGETAADLLKEGGVDLSMFKGKPGICISRDFCWCRHRWLKSHGRLTPLGHLWREYDFDPDYLETYRNPGRSMVNLHSRYFETDIGRREPFKGFWWRNPPWRANAVTPCGEHFMEYYAHALAAFDADIITCGGYTLGTVGHEEEVGRFAQEFRPVPGAYFERSPLSRGPVVLREANVSGKHYFYLVNKCSWPVRCVLTLSREDGKVTSLSSGEEMKTQGGGLRLDLEPYGLRSFAGRVAGLKVELPDEAFRRPDARVAELKGKIARLEKASGDVAEYKRLLARAAELKKAQRIHDLGILLNGYAAAGLLSSGEE